MKSRKKGRSSLSSVLVILSLVLFSIGSIWLVVQIIRIQNDFTRTSRDDETAVASEDKGTVLFLASYSPSFTTFNAEQQGLEKVLEANGYDLDVACMDAKMFYSAKHKEAFHQLVAERIREGADYCGVIAADDSALHFICDYQDELFPDLPIVYFAVNDEEFAGEASKDERIAGYIEDNGIASVLEMTTKLMPQAEKIVAIHDETVSGLANKEAFLKCEEKFPDLSFAVYDFQAHTAEETEEYISSLDMHTIVISLDAFWDADGNYYSIEQAGKLLTSHAGIPIFRDGAGGYTSGYTAGSYMDFEHVAGLAAEKLIEGIASGRLEDSGEPLPGDDAMFAYSYSEKNMEKYHLDKDVFPENTLVVQQTDGFWDTYRTVLGPIMMILAGLISGIAYYQINYRQSVKREQALAETVADLHKSHEDLQWASEHDHLTGLINRHTALKRLIAYGETHDDYSVVLIDVDNFKTVNEIYGHENGDIILVEMARRLQRFCEEENCRAYRYGGDEFLVLSFDKLKDDYEPKLKKLFSLCKKPLKIGMDLVVPSSSMGIASADGKSTMEEVILNADIALNQAKVNGKNMQAVFTSDMKQEVNTISLTKAAIIDAVEHDGFTMVYQPKVNIQNGHICGYEALCRMKNRNISPGVFIPIAESSGWIRQIGRITTEKTVRQMAEWRDRGMELHPVSINFSSAQIGDRQFIPFLKALLAKYDIPSEMVEIEITESLWMHDSREAHDLMQSFNEMGIHILMDDFGTGYSSLSYLTYIPVSVIKLDKSLVDAYLDEGEGEFIRDVITLAHDLKKSVTVEGVENRDQYLKLKKFGCDDIQGYYFAKPLKAEDVPAYHIPEDKF